MTLTFDLDCSTASTELSLFRTRIWTLPVHLDRFQEFRRQRQFLPYRATIYRNFSNNLL